MTKRGTLDALVKKNPLVNEEQLKKGLRDLAEIRSRPRSGRRGYELEFPFSSPRRKGNRHPRAVYLG